MSWLHWLPTSLDIFQSWELTNLHTMWGSSSFQKAFRQPTPSFQRKWGTVVGDVRAAQTAKHLPLHFPTDCCRELGCSDRGSCPHPPAPSSPHPSSPLPLLHHQQLVVSLQTRQEQPAANSFLLRRFLCSSFGGTEWPEGLPGTAARRKGEKDLSSGTKVGLCFPG